MSKLIYCITVWGFNLTKEELRKLQVLQNKCLRLISHSKYDTPRISLLNKCKKLSVKQLIIYQTACQTFRIFHSKYTKYHYRKLFSSDNISNPGTKSHDDDCQANKIGYNLSVSRNQFFYQASLIWNNLPVHIKKLEKVDTFKKHLKQWITTNIQPF